MGSKRLKETACTILLLAAATAISFAFFYLGNKNVANITVIYSLALILTALYTSGYLYGIIASLFCVIAVNYFFSYPYFKVNFYMDGYPTNIFYEYVTLSESYAPKKNSVHYKVSTASTSTLNVPTGITVYTPEGMYKAQ